MRPSRFVIPALAALLAATSASALTATQTVEKEIVVQNPDGTESLVRQPAEMVTPGERVVYTLAYTNDQADPVNDIVLTMPVPAEVTYVEGSAERAGTTITVSTDNGASYTPRGAAMVVEAGTPRRAEAADITHIRWRVTSPVAPGATDRLAFKAVLN